VPAVAGAFGIWALIGLVVLMTAEEPLVGAARAVVRDVGQCFRLGLLWQLLALPLLGVVVLGLAITIVGILAIPVAVLAWVLTYVGAVTLGSLAVALVIGRALGGRGPARSSRAVELRSLLIGLVTLATLWFVTVSLSGIPVVGLLARVVALACSWVVATVGLGAVATGRVGALKGVIRFGRGGVTAGGFGAGGATTGARAAGEAPVAVVDPLAEEPAYSWLTPTPVQGVVAAKRAGDTLRQP
jgi:hypothetical protein